MLLLKIFTAVQLTHPMLGSLIHTCRQALFKPTDPDYIGCIKTSVLSDARETNNWETWLKYLQSNQTFAA